LPLRHAVILGAEAVALLEVVARLEVVALLEVVVPAAP